MYRQFQHRAGSISVVCNLIRTLSFSLILLVQSINVSADVMPLGTPLAGSFIDHGDHGDHFDHVNWTAASPVPVEPIDSPTEIQRGVAVKSGSADKKKRGGAVTTPPVTAPEVPRPMLRQEEPKGWVWVTQTVDITKQMGGEQNMMTLDGEPLPSMLRRRVTLGLVLDNQGHIITRLIDVTPQNPPTAVSVRSASTRMVSARFVGMDLVSGLCILKVEDPNLKPVPFYTPKTLPARLDIRLYGFNPNQRMSPNASTIYTSPRRNIYTGKVTKALGDFRYQAANPIYYLTTPKLTAAQDGSLVLGPGNEIFGMAIYDSAGQGQHLVYPISRISSIAKSIINTRESLRYGWFGATGIDATVGPPSRIYSGSVDNTGVRIIAVAPDSPADKAGIRPKDILLSVNDRRITNYAQLATVVRQLPPDSEITVRVRRGQEIKTLKSKLVPAPSIEPEQQLLAFARRLESMEEELRRIAPNDQRRATLSSKIEMMRTFVGAITLPAPPAIRLRVFYGIEILPLTSQLMAHFSVERGVLVSSVLEKAAAPLAGLRSGDIIIRVGETSVSDLNSLLGTLDKARGTSISLSVIRNREEKLVRIDPRQ